MLVSVLINNYNYGKYLERCISSVLSQTHPQIEIILYDDASTDDSLEIAERFKEKIKIIKGKEKFQYPSFNQANGMNKAFTISNGEIICLLDSDDYYTANKVEKIVEIFSKNIDVVLVQHALYEIYENKISNKYDKRKRNTAYYNPTSALSFRREYFKQLLPLEIDNLWRVWPDVRLSRIAPYFGKVFSTNECLGYYRRHDLNDSSSMNSSQLNSLKNQIAHHKYLNLYLTKNNKVKVNYFLSTSFFKYIIKCLIPAKIFKMIKREKRFKLEGL